MLCTVYAFLRVGGGISIEGVVIAVGYDIVNIIFSLLRFTKFHILSSVNRASKFIRKRLFEQSYFSNERVLHLDFSIGSLYVPTSNVLCTVFVLTFLLLFAMFISRHISYVPRVTFTYY